LDGVLSNHAPLFGTRHLVGIEAEAHPALVLILDFSDIIRIRVNINDSWSGVDYINKEDTDS